MTLKLTVELLTGRAVLSPCNTVNIHPTQGFLDHLAQGGMSFDDAAAQQHAAVCAHNERETLLFAISIARKAQTNLPPE